MMLAIPNRVEEIKYQGKRFLVQVFSGSLGSAAKVVKELTLVQAKRNIVFRTTVTRMEEI